MYSQYEILNFGTFLKIYFTKKMLKKSFRKIRYIRKKASSEFNRHK